MVYGRYHTDARACVLKLYRAMHPELFGPFERPLLNATARVPTLVLWGDLDPYVPASFASRFGGVVRRFAELGHWPMVERPKPIAAAIGEWTLTQSLTRQNQGPDQRELE